MNYPSKELVDEAIEEVRKCILTKGDLSYFIYRREPGDDPEETGSNRDIEIHISPSALEIVEPGPHDGAIVSEHIVVDVAKLVCFIDDEEGDVPDCVMAMPCDEDHRPCIIVDGFYDNYSITVKVFMMPFPDEKGTPYHPSKE